MLTPREMTYSALNFTNPPRAPREIWALPIATEKHPEKWAQIQQRFPQDTTSVDPSRPASPTKGDAYRIGEHIDAWGCKFNNIQDGVIGEVKDPIVKDWKDIRGVRVPREWLKVDRDAVNRQCAKTDRFVLAGDCPRPFEQLQFIRGSEPLYCDLADPSDELLAFIKTMHDFYCELLEVWAKTDIDGLRFMDDWGSQKSLLISPRMWRQLFKPLYKDYCDIAHSAGKKIFFHSDGHILSVFDDLVSVGVDAINAQIFCMGIENLAPWKGKITFWGEIDRQYILSRGTLAEVEAAVKLVHKTLWANGGCFALVEFGPGSNPDNVYRALEVWDALTTR